jgi:hypothetical protein
MSVEYFINGKSIKFTLNHHELYTDIDGVGVLKVWYKDLPPDDVVEEEILNQLNNYKAGCNLLDCGLVRWFKLSYKSTNFELEKYEKYFTLNYMEEGIPGHFGGDALAFIPEVWNVEKQKRIIKSFLDGEK